MRLWEQGPRKGVKKRVEPVVHYLEVEYWQGYCLADVACTGPPTDVLCKFRVATAFLLKRTLSYTERFAKFGGYSLARFTSLVVCLLVMS